MAQDRQEIATATYDSLAKFFNEDGVYLRDGFRLLIEDVKKVAKVDREVAFRKSGGSLNS